jgi:hypothetical protein
MVQARSLLGRVFILLICCVIFCFSLLALSREVQTTLLLQAPDEQRLQAMRRFDPALQMASVPALTQMMTLCTDLLLVNERVRLAPQLQGDIGATCQAYGRRILRKNPGFARALAVGLLGGDPARFAADYAQAQAAAGFEPWPLQVRVLAADRVIRRSLGTLTLELQLLLTQDLARLMQMDQGQALLAQLYAQNSPLRPLIQDLAPPPTAPIEARKFVANG